MAGGIAEFTSNGGTAQGYLARPESGSGPGLIVIQEYWGLVDHIKDVADRLAAEGFVALAPDLFHGKQLSEPDEAGKMMMALNIQQAAKDIRGAVDYLLQQDLSTHKVGIIGFCMGGQLALYGACEHPQIAACADFYGVHPAVKPDLSSLNGPVLGIFAEKDDMTTPAAVHQLAADMDAAGKSFSYTIYPGVDHAFFNDTRPEVYNAVAANDAWASVLAFFHDNLGT
ncbi:MAG: dienelactone hydrolase family protein [Chloroflexota bacterium]